MNFVIVSFMLSGFLTVISAVTNFSSFFYAFLDSAAVTVVLCEEDGSSVELINATKGLLSSTTVYSVTTGLRVLLPP